MSAQPVAQNWSSSPSDQPTRRGRHRRRTRRRRRSDPEAAVSPARAPAARTRGPSCSPVLPALREGSRALVRPRRPAAHLRRRGPGQGPRRALAPQRRPRAGRHAREQHHRPRRPCRRRVLPRVLRRLADQSGRRRCASGKRRRPRHDLPPALLRDPWGSVRTRARSDYDDDDDGPPPADPSQRIPTPTGIFGGPIPWPHRRGGFRVPAGAGPQDSGTTCAKTSRSASSLEAS